MNVDAVCSDKRTHLMGSSKGFIIFSSQWVRRTGANSGGLRCNTLDTLETSRHELMETRSSDLTLGWVRR